MGESKRPRMFKSCLKQNLLLILTLVGVIFGFVVGFSVRPTRPSRDTLVWIGLPGELYLRLLKMMIVPLVVCSIITGTSSMDPKANGKISLVAFIFIFLTNMVGALLGIAMFLLFKPGQNSLNHSEENLLQAIQTQDIFVDLIRNIVPDNLFEATFSQSQTQYLPSKNGSTATQMTKTVGKTSGANLLGLIFACTFIGIAAASLKKKGKPFVKFFSSLTDIILVVVRWFMWTTPLGVCSLITFSIAGIDDLMRVFQDLGVFIAAITVGLAIHQLVAMSVILFALTRRNPLRVWLVMAKPWLIAFALTSTAAIMPEMFHSCEHKLKIDKRVTRFVIPFSVTLSANGSAVFIACSCLFISNLTNNAPEVKDILIIGMLATVTSLAIPSVPSASIVTIVMILSSLNIPLEAVALLLAVDWYS